MARAGPLFHPAERARRKGGRPKAGRGTFDPVATLPASHKAPDRCRGLRKGAPQARELAVLPDLGHILGRDPRGTEKPRALGAIGHSHKGGAGQVDEPCVETAENHESPPLLGESLREPRRGVVAR